MATLSSSTQSAGAQSNHLTLVAEQFNAGGNMIQVRALGNGNINDTYLVTTDASKDNIFVLQRINTNVFRHPKLIMQNMHIFTDHVLKRIHVEGLHWEIPHILPARDGQDFYIDTDSNFWRAVSYIQNTQSFDTVTNTSLAHEVGRALGTFQYLLSDLPADQLADTLEGFHITPRYLDQLDHILSHSSFKRNAEVNYCLNFVEQRRGFAHILEEARAQGELHLRVVHGDPKVNNVMIENSTGRAISLVDLDTVKPGLIHYDIGDCIRSGSNPLGEDAEDWEAVQFDPEIGAALLEGYLVPARHFLTPAESEYIFDAIHLLAFEQGLRFLADYLAGDVYYKVRHTEHNLQRALVQFKLTESIKTHEVDIRDVIEKIVNKNRRKNM